MAFSQLVPEDGTGLANANTYCSLSYSISYFSVKQNTAWLALDSQQQELYLIQATDVLDQRYGLGYRGNILTETQSLLFPRTTFADKHGRVIEAGTIPDSLKNAQCEMAILAMDGSAEVDPNQSQNNLKSYTDKVDVLEETKEYFGPISSSTYSQVTRILNPIMVNTFGGFQATAVRG